MLISSFHASVSHSCGISIFSRHFRNALSPLGIDVLETNLRAAEMRARAPISLVHYAPSSFISEEASGALVRLLTSLRDDERLCVILHGAHRYGETRFERDGICPNQGNHIRLLSKKADFIVALSDSVADAFQSWHSESEAQFIRIDHPGLFASAQGKRAIPPYAFVGGISRPKKAYASRRIGKLIEQCESRDIRIWQHWTNASHFCPFQNSWKQSCGLLTDIEWSSAIAGASVVLCPYQSRIQTVSGLISEALSVGRFVVATSFSAALEMQRRTPALIYVENDLERWPDLISELLPRPIYEDIRTPTWEAFAKRISKELFQLPIGDIYPSQFPKHVTDARCAFCRV